MTTRRKQYTAEFKAKVALEALKEQQTLAELGIRITMDGRGRALDNVFIERLWRTVK